MKFERGISLLHFISLHFSAKTLKLGPMKIKQIKIAKIARVGLILSLPLIISCSETEMGLQFKMEKAVVNANKLKKQLYLSEGLDRQEAEQLRTAYKEVIGLIKTPPGDSAMIAGASVPLNISWQMAGLAYYSLGLLEMEMENYNEAFDNFSSLINSYGFHPHQVQKAIFMQALARYKQDRFTEAILLYNKVAGQYASDPLSVLNPNMDALESPLTAAKIFQEIESGKKFERQIGEAIDYYLNLIVSYEGSPLADAAIGKLASAFLLGDLADSAVTALSSVRDSESDRIPPLVLMNIANIQQKNLKDYKAAEKSYRDLVEFYPDNALAGTARLGIGVSLYMRENYEQARFELSLIDKLPRVTNILLAEAHYLTASCFELEGKWERALGEYDFVWANHAASEKGMSVPIHIAEYYQNKGQAKLAAQSFEEAEKDYKRLIDIYNSRPDVTVRATGFLVRSLLSQEKWEEAIKALEGAAQKYPRTTLGYSALPKAAEILAVKLNRPVEAADFLELFLTKFPNAPEKERISTYADSLRNSL